MINESAAFWQLEETVRGCRERKRLIGRRAGATNNRKEGIGFGLGRRSGGAGRGQAVTAQVASFYGQREGLLDRLPHWCRPGNSRPVD